MIILPSDRTIFGFLKNRTKKTKKLRNELFMLMIKRNKFFKFYENFFRCLY